MARQSLSTVVVGAKKQGKSTWLNNHLEQSSKKNVLLYKSDKTIDDAAFKGYRRIHKLSDFRGGKAKISDRDISYPDFMKMVMEHLKNCALVVDDATMFERHTLSQELKDLVILCRHVFVDVYYIFHSIRYVPIEMFEGIDRIVLFYNTGNFSSKINSLPEAETLVEAQENAAKLYKAGVKYHPIVVSLNQ